MTLSQRTALKAAFPNIKHIILVNHDGTALGGSDLDACHYHASKLGLTKEPPKLKSQAAFFVKHHTALTEKAMEIFPQELKDFMAHF